YARSLRRDAISTNGSAADCDSCRSNSGSGARRLTHSLWLWVHPNRPRSIPRNIFDDGGMLLIRPECSGRRPPDTSTSSVFLVFLPLEPPGAEPHAGWCGRGLATTNPYAVCRSAFSRPATRASSCWRLGPCRHEAGCTSIPSDRRSARRRRSDPPVQPRTVATDRCCRPG
ncbi:MAG: hypothetical protein JWL83_3119, partial [Actinomycetia bacterium]|nr:hypothetical protein [Actinomycetes bacterium]